MPFDVEDNGTVMSLRYLLESTMLSGSALTNLTKQPHVLYDQSQ